MKKRITAIMLAFVLGITAVPEMVYAAGDENTQQAEVAYYTISFNTAGGTQVAPLQTAEGEVPDSAAVGVTERKGYLFRGWRDELGAYYDFSQPVTKDMVLTAEWMPISYKVRFDKNGGVGSMPEQVLTYDKEEALKYNRFTRSGYVF